MHERTLNSKLIVSDAMRKYNHEAYKVPITDELIKLGHGAYRTYQNFLDEQKRIIEEENKKKYC